MGGATTVEMRRVMMATPKRSWPITPAERPIPATISVTSPRGSMPAPIRKAPRRLKPVSRAGTPAPSSLPAMANRLNTIPKNRTGGRTEKSTSIPITQKKVGTI